MKRLRAAASVKSSGACRHPIFLGDVDVKNASRPFGDQATPPQRVRVEAVRPCKPKGSQCSVHEGLNVVTRSRKGPTATSPRLGASQ